MIWLEMSSHNLLRSERLRDEAAAIPSCFLIPTLNWCQQSMLSNGTDEGPYWILWPDWRILLDNTTIDITDWTAIRQLMLLTELTGLQYALAFGQTNTTFKLGIFPNSAQGTEMPVALDSMYYHLWSFELIRKSNLNYSFAHILQLQVGAYHCARTTLGLLSLNWLCTAYDATSIAIFISTSKLQHLSRMENISSMKRNILGSLPGGHYTTTWWAARTWLQTQEQLTRQDDGITAWYI